ncbi:unnamed protein product, partial [Brenthis ino]
MVIFGGGLYPAVAHHHKDLYDDDDDRNVCHTVLQFVNEAPDGGGARRAHHVQQVGARAALGQCGRHVIQIHFRTKFITILLKNIYY